MSNFKALITFHDKVGSVFDADRIVAIECGILQESSEFFKYGKYITYMYFPGYKEYMCEFFNSEKDRADRIVLLTGYQFDSTGE